MASLLQNLSVLHSTTILNFNFCEILFVGHIRQLYMDGIIDKWNDKAISIFDISLTILPMESLQSYWQTVET